MILDTSAILAVLFDEPEQDQFLRKIGAATRLGVGAPTLVEAAIVLCGARGNAGRTQLAGFVERADAVVIPFEAVHWSSAVGAWLRYGKGRHPAGLNYGDVSPTRPQRSLASRCSARAPTSRRPTWCSRSRRLRERERSPFPLPQTPRSGLGGRATSRQHGAAGRPRSAGCAAPFLSCANYA